LEEENPRSESGLVAVVTLLPVDLFFLVGGVFDTLEDFLVVLLVDRCDGVVAAARFRVGGAMVTTTNVPRPSPLLLLMLLNKQNYSTLLMDGGSRTTRFYMWFSKRRIIRHLLLARGRRITRFYTVLPKQNLQKQNPLTPFVADQTFCLWSELLF
jgi:hypothetical protein